MKIIFLDFDGVLNSDPYLARYFASPRLDEADDHQMLDPENLGVLDAIVNATGAHIVISSSWRLESDAHELSAVLRRGGLSAAERVVDVTPDLAGPRFAEIQRWLDAHAEVEAFVILDDEKSMGHLAARHVWTSPAGGLREEHVERAIGLLSQLWRKTELL
jgi:hypothetical protein